MPNRILRESLLDSPRYNRLSSAEAKIFFVELLLLADDYGLLPLDETFLRRKTTVIGDRPHESTVKLITELADADLVRVFEASGKRFGWIPRFRSDARGRCALKPKWPVPPDCVDGGEVKRLMARRTADKTGARA